MSRHVLTPEEQLRGIRAAIASPRTPPQLRNALKERMTVLHEKTNRQQRRREAIRKKRKRKAGLLDWLGL